MFCRRRGYSLAMWAVIFAIVISGLLVMRNALNKGLRMKTKMLSDSLLWYSWDQKPEYKADKTSFSRSKSTQHNIAATLETRDGKLKKYTGPGQLSIPSSTENTVSFSVEEGSESSAKRVDVDDFD